MDSPGFLAEFRGYLAARKRFWLLPLLLLLAVVALVTLLLFGPESLLDGIYGDF